MPPLSIGLSQIRLLGPIPKQRQGALVVAVKP